MINTPVGMMGAGTVFQWRSGGKETLRDIEEGPINADGVKSWTIHLFQNSRFTFFSKAEWGNVLCFSNSGLKNGTDIVAILDKDGKPLPVYGVTDDNLLLLV